MCRLVFGDPARHKPRQHWIYPTQRQAILAWPQNQPDASNRFSVVELGEADWVDWADLLQHPFVQNSTEALFPFSEVTLTVAHQQIHESP